MGLEKVTYVDGTTVITAQNLNAIQDSIIDLEASRTVPSNVRNAIYTLLENAAYATTGLEDEIAVVEAWAEEVTSLTLSVSTLSLNNDVPQAITATTVPSGATVTWSSSNNSVATVSDGIVTGVSNGSCVITAYAGELFATCDVTVAGFSELVSISAVYTQSGEVYTTDSLDSLKADLVVTATYSDSSTATIPSTDYTLSGTLTVGTSTITVVYGGKTDSFNVTVSSMPELYSDSEIQTYGTSGTFTEVTGGIDIVSNGNANWNLYAFPKTDLPTYGELENHTIKLEYDIDATSLGNADQFVIAFDAASNAGDTNRQKQRDLIKTVHASPDSSGTYEFVVNSSLWTGGSGTVTSSSYLRFRTYLYGANGTSVSFRYKFYDLGVLS